MENPETTTMAASLEKLADFRQTHHPACNGTNGSAPTSSAQVKERATAWQRVVDEKLIEWGRHPSQFDDDGIKPPNSVVLANACEFACFCRDNDIDPPLRVAPDGSGGVVFEWRAAPLYFTVEVNASGSAQLLVFENSKLLNRKPIG
jgi:hypothetical protein